MKFVWVGFMVSGMGTPQTLIISEYDSGFAVLELGSRICFGVDWVVGEQTWFLQLLDRNVHWSRGGIVCKAHRLVCHSLPGLRVTKRKKKKKSTPGPKKKKKKKKKQRRGR